MTETLTLSAKTVYRGQRLSERELQVLWLASEGRSAKETAVRLGINEETVKTYRRCLLFKLGARNMANAVYLALTTGVIFPQEEPDEDSDDRYSRENPKRKASIR